jgi:hypothetical protein
MEETKEQKRLYALNKEQEKVLKSYCFGTNFEEIIFCTKDNCRQSFEEIEGATFNSTAKAYEEFLLKKHKLTISVEDRREIRIQSIKNFDKF